MKIWLASSDIPLIKKALPAGIFAGVITNPKVVAEAGMAPEMLFRRICEHADAAYYQLRDDSQDEMMAEAERFIAIDSEKMRIKVPATIAGLGVIRKLSDQGHPVMATIVPTATWLVYALAAGARVIAPYGGMLQKRGIVSKADEVVRMQAIIDAQNAEAELCVGIYDPTEIPFYASKGIRSCFVWGSDLELLLSQPLVDEAVASFNSDWSAIEDIV